jgi:hypothetical protein
MRCARRPNHSAHLHLHLPLTAPDRRSPQHPPDENVPRAVLDCPEANQHRQVSCAASPQLNQSADPPGGAIRPRSYTADASTHTKRRQSRGLYLTTAAAPDSTPCGMAGMKIPQMSPRPGSSKRLMDRLNKSRMAVLQDSPGKGRPRIANRAGPHKPGTCRSRDSNIFPIMRRQQGAVPPCK